ncbi:CVNH domain-containing protein [Xylariomycetidae sp. FL0641]|nr:CVNH domain-containing protein [Xylariomycetidae sp. FL0641]
MKLSLTAVAAILAAPAVASHWYASCEDSSIDPLTNILYSSCDTGDGLGTFADAQLDLNTCFGYQDGEIIQEADGNFGASCGECVEYMLPDPIYGDCCGRTIPWIDCICAGSTVSYEIGSSLIDNKFGTLSCH